MTRSATHDFEVVYASMFLVNVLFDRLVESCR